MTLTLARRRIRPPAVRLEGSRMYEHRMHPHLSRADFTKRTARHVMLALFALALAKGRCHQSEFLSFCLLCPLSIVSAPMLRIINSLEIELTSLLKSPLAPLFQRRVIPPFVKGRLGGIFERMS
jgi:hypothetical protein